ncbi:hypothetical protein BC936DRAFT_142160 [Jimgerdemannia flammicorona]|uniref:DUF4097 domain-containing protein n=1 Tax=Jimgerdemannia flammicorona TaxID=994334 RepID=A0A433A0U4_9FUNG|nr:hypothetical protein BC936DRAFT_142160 [Jimgerdemannia flammicorona]
MVTTGIVYHGSESLPMVHNDNFEVNAFELKSLVFKLTTFGSGFIRIVQPDNSSNYEDYGDNKIHVSIKVFADHTDWFERIQIIPTKHQNNFSLVIANADNQSINRNNTFVITNRLHIKMVVTIPISLNHLEKLQLESNSQNIKIDDVDELFTESVLVKTNSGKISVVKSLDASAISLETVSGALGPMTLSAATSLSAKTTSGHIDIQQQPDSTTSSVRLETASGDIGGKFVAGQHFTANTISGSVNVVVNASESGSRPSVDLQTISGIIDGCVSVGKRLKLTSVSGPVKLQLDLGSNALNVTGSSVSGNLTINFLRPFAGDFALATLFGRMKILTSTKSSVKYREKRKTKLVGQSSTMGVKVCEGSIKLDTMSGNIELGL